MFVALKVSGAFHSRYMKEPAAEFAKFIETITIKDTNFPVIANVTAKEYENGAQIKELLIQQIYSSVLWVDTILGLKSKGEIDFVEIGSGNVLTKLLRKIK